MSSLKKAMNNMITNILSKSFIYLGDDRTQKENSHRSSGNGIENGTRLLNIN